MTPEELEERLSDCLSEAAVQRLDDGCTHEDMASIYENAFNDAEQVARDAIEALRNALKSTGST